MLPFSSWVLVTVVNVILSEELLLNVNKLSSVYNNFSNIYLFCLRICLRTQQKYDFYSLFIWHGSHNHCIKVWKLLDPPVRVCAWDLMFNSDSGRWERNANDNLSQECTSYSDQTRPNVRLLDGDRVSEEVTGMYLHFKTKYTFFFFYTFLARSQWITN